MKIKIKKPNLADYQKAFLYNNSRFTITEASTKAGKTFAHIWWIYERAHEDWNKPNYNHWWVAPVYSQAQIAFKRLKVKLAPTGAYKINESNLIITCPNGVHIHFKSADKPDNLFGEDVYSIVFDEAPRAKRDAFYALRSTITATKGVVKMIGNFGGVANWMHQLKEKAKKDPEYSYYKITAYDAVKAGILDAEEVEQARRDLPESIFMQLYMAEAKENPDQLITYDAMQNMPTNQHAISGDKYITADIALHGSDKFVVLVWNGWRVQEIIIKDKIEPQEVEKLLKDKAEQYGVGRTNICYDADGLGSYLRGYLKGAYAFVNNARPIGKVDSTNKVQYANLKSQCGYEIAKVANRNEIAIDCEFDKSKFFAELEVLQSHALDKDGKLRTLPKEKQKEILGHSPDMLDAFLMRMVYELNPNKGKYSIF